MKFVVYRTTVEKFVVKASTSEEALEVAYNVAPLDCNDQHLEVLPIGSDDLEQNLPEFGKCDAEV